MAHAVATAWYDKASDVIGAFEADFAALTGRAHAIAMPSGTAALHLSLLGLGLGPGDEVIVPESTWVATAAAIVYVGATPIFADVDPHHWCLDPASFEALITPRTRAVMPVDLYGGFPDYALIEKLAALYDIAVVEDSAQSAGGAFQGRPAGSFGVASAFSFHGSKTMTTGEGGMVVCDDDELWRRMLFLRDHGRMPGDFTFRSTEVAWKYKMSSLQAALGRVQVERLDELVARKREIFTWYRELLSDLPLTLNVERPGDHNTHWMTTVVLDESVGVTGTDLAAALAADDIASRPFFPPLSSIGAFATARDTPRAASANNVAISLARQSINLPSALMLERRDVERVCATISSMLGN